MNRATMGSVDPSSVELAATAGVGNLGMLAVRHKVAAALFPNASTPTTLGRFRILEALGAGAMGTVYAAWDPELERRVAIKVLNWRAPATATIRKEAKALARLNHPNVTTVHEVGTVGDQVFVAMEFIKGRTLTTVATQADGATMIDLYLQAARGLAAAHDAGLVHRDFKPDNVMVGDDGRVRVVDFGLARNDGTPLEGDGEVPLLSMSLEEITRTGAVVGTPAYMAPEQLAGAPADARSDQFAWCVSLCEALTQRRPWDASTLGELGDRVRAEPPDLSGVPADLRRVLKRGLAHDPEDRWGSMEAIAGAVVKARRARGRRRAGVVAGVLAAGVGVASLSALVVDPSAASQAPFCVPADEKLAADWDSDVVGKLTGDADDPATLATELDGWATEWRETYEQACAAEDEVARDCADDILTQASGFIEATADADWALQRAGAWPLVEPSRCRPGGPGTGLPALPPALALDVGRLRFELQREMLRPSNHLLWIEGEAISGPTQSAAALDYAPVQVEAEYVSASRMRAKHSFDEAERMARDALARAEAIGHRLVVAKLRLLLAEIASAVGRDVRTVRGALDEARRAVELLPPEDASMAAQLERDLGVIAIESGHRVLYPDAVIALQGALAGFPDGSDDKAEIMLELADGLQQLRRFADARPYWDALVQQHREAAARATEPLDRLQQAAELAETLAMSGDHREGIRVLRDALDEAPVGLQSWLKQASFQYIGDWSLHLGDVDSAVEAFEAVLRVRVRVEGDETAIRSVEQGFAAADVLRGKLDAAEARLSRVASSGAEAWLHERIAWLRLALGRDAGAARSAALAFADARERYQEQDEALRSARLVHAAALLATGEASASAALLDHDYVLAGDDSGAARMLLSLALARQGRDATRAAELKTAADRARATPVVRPHLDAELVWRGVMHQAIDRLQAETP